MKCEVEITNVWATFNIPDEVIIEFNKEHNVPEHLLGSFKVADALGFDAFHWAGQNCRDWEFSEFSEMYAYKNQSGNTWSEFDDDNNVTDKDVEGAI